MPIVSTRDVELHKRIKKFAVERGVPIYEVIERLVRLGLDLDLLAADKESLGKIQELLKEEK